MSVRSYETVRGFFVQGPPTATSTVTSPIPEFFGLASRSWPEFVAEIDGLCSRRSESVSYKVLFLGRHGEGYHNFAISKYGQKAWDEKWSRLNGDGELTWGPDPHLTTIGEEQARSAHAAWKHEILHGIPVPQRFYCSPLTRAIRTLEITFENILPAHLKPVILEDCREEYVEHTCDRRRTRSELQSEFPHFVFEEGLEEDDVLWSSEHETKESVERRAKLVLDRIFQNDHNDTYISITSHCGWIRGVLNVIGGESYDLPTGGLVAVVVKGTGLQVCNSCAEPIVGIRYQCLNCPSIPNSYNLCSDCEVKSYRVHDPLHIFLKIPRPVDILGPLESKSPFIPILYRDPAGPAPGSPSAYLSGDPAAYLRDLTHTFALCDRHLIRIVGKWYRCAFCAQDLCGDCEMIDTHDDTHVFLVFKAPVDMDAFRLYAGLENIDGSPPVLHGNIYYPRDG